MRVNLARGLRRIWIAGTIPWIVYCLYHYSTKCFIYPEAIRCWSLRGNSYSYDGYTTVQYFMTLIEAAITPPVLVFVLGTVIFWVGRWIAKGFQPSQPQAGE